MVSINPEVARQRRQQLITEHNLIQQCLLKVRHDAEKFRDRFYKGDKLSKCLCGKVLQFKNSMLVCDDCGRRHNRVVFMNQYADDVWAQVTLDVEKGQFKIELNDTDDFSKEDINGENGENNGGSGGDGLSGLILP
jgi:hypothetical protein